MATLFWTDFRRRFTRGLAAILPTVLTISLIVWLFQTIDKYISQYINDWSRAIIVKFMSTPETLDATTAKVTAFWDVWHLNAIGFILAIVLVYVVGLFVASFIGRAVWRGVETLLVRIPMIKQIYPSIKQVTDFIILNENKVKFSRVVAVEYPRKDVYSIGLVTSDGVAALQQAIGGDLITVFIPSSPTPFTGYTVIVRRDEVVDLPYSIEEALQFTISGGVVHPKRGLTQDAERDVDEKPIVAPSSETDSPT